MNLRTWADDHGEWGDDQDPWACFDEERVAVDAGESVATAFRAWEDAACDEDPARREWLALLTAIDKAEGAIANGPGCQCYECHRAGRRVEGYRAEAIETAGEFGLPRPTAAGRIPRYPVNVGAIAEKAARLVAESAVWILTEGIYIVIGDTGAYYVHARGAAPLDWTCSCPWGQPQPDASGRPGRGCAHVLAAHRIDVGQAAAANAVRVA